MNEYLITITGKFEFYGYGAGFGGFFHFEFYDYGFETAFCYFITFGYDYESISLVTRTTSTILFFSKNEIRPFLNSKFNKLSFESWIIAQNSL